MTRVHRLPQRASPESRTRGAKELQVKDLTVKPIGDMRKFQVATLDNGIQVLTVKDTHALQKGFAAAVEAGSFDDPVELPGLAHFCEHMLFLGTKKYTDPIGFDKFMP